MARLSDDLTRLLDVGIERVRVEREKRRIDEMTERELTNALLDSRARVTEHLSTAPKFPESEPA